MEEKFEIFYVRHGDTGGASCDDRDSCDVSLSDTGRAQAELLRQRLEGARFDAVFSSPLVRCVETASIVCAGLEGDPEIEIFPGIIENGSTYGYFGQTPEYLGRYYPHLVLNTDLPPYYGNVTDEDNDRRARIAAGYFRSRFTYGQRILLFCHGSFANHFLPQAVEMNGGNFILSCNNTSLSKIKYTADGKQRLSFVNDFSHLRPLMPDYEFTV